VKDDGVLVVINFSILYLYVGLYSMANWFNVGFSSIAQEKKFNCLPIYLASLILRMIFGLFLVGNCRKLPLKI